ncbi:imidazole glycerol phosphate synthase cyclase subunit [bacterium]|nr:imidazole glycerol phosphate synthase cyclase subunit [bacterium]
MKFRIIARLDIKKNALIKGVHLEGVRVVGDPLERAHAYYLDGVDEILLIDSVASLYQRNNLADIIYKICREIFIPVTVGGGIRTVEDAQRLFDVGADKIAINTAAITDPSLLERLVSRFGAQAVVLSIQAKKDPINSDRWIAMTDNGRENSNLSVTSWLEIAKEYGFGELLLTSIDQEGTGSGFDFDLLKLILPVVNVPVLISGGFGTSSHAVECFQVGAQAAVIAQAFHYNSLSINSLKNLMHSSNIPVRL